MRNMQYQVALSFAGEQRSYVEKVARNLQARSIVVFYDDFEKISLWGENAAEAFDKAFAQQANYKVLRELKKIKLAWKDLNYSTAPGVLILHPSTPVIAPLNQGQLAS